MVGLLKLPGGSLSNSHLKTEGITASGQQGTSLGNAARNFGLAKAHAQNWISTDDHL